MFCRSSGGQEAAGKGEAGGQAAEDGQGKASGQGSGSGSRRTQAALEQHRLKKAEAAEFVNSVAERVAASSKGNHVNIRDYNRSHSNELRAAMGAVRHDAAAAGASMDTG